MQGRTCKKCQKHEDVGWYASGYYCETCVPREHGVKARTIKPETRPEVALPEQYAQQVEEAAFPRAVLGFTRKASQLGLYYDVRKSVGPEPERAEVFCVRVRKGDERLAALWYDGRFKIALLKTKYGARVGNSTQAKEWMGEVTKPG